MENYSWYFGGGLCMYGALNMLIFTESNTVIGIGATLFCFGCFLVYLGLTDK
jgi:hypothetical protein